ncbi:MAG: hypothetical protein OEU32_10835, partial [Acidimicrobiia bacterium]|nr:hypothetical protein [Acidimicrobiia bacterium]
MKRPVMAAVVAALLAALVPFIVVASSGDAGAVTTYSVTTNDDTFTPAIDDDDLSLREAIERAEDDGDDSVIDLAAPGEFYTLDRCNGAGPQEEDGRTGQLEHEPRGVESLTINGNGSTVIQTCNRRVLKHETTGALAINALTITGGNGNGNGAGVFTNGPTVLDATTITQNVSNNNSGGGVYATDALTVQNGSVVSNNWAFGAGGGIASFGADIDATDLGSAAAGGPLIVTGSSHVDGNIAGFEGGGISASGQVNVTAASTVDGNFVGMTFDGFDRFYQSALPEATQDCALDYFFTGARGGGIAAHSKDTDVDVSVSGGSSVSGNVSCGGGGGIYAAYTGTVSVDASSVDGNASYFDGGGIAADGVTVSATNGATVDGNQAGFQVFALNGCGLQCDVAFELSAVEDCPTGGGQLGSSYAAGGGIAYYSGGGDGSVVVSASSVSGNTACGDGGGIFYPFFGGQLPGTVTIEAGSTVSGNVAAGANCFGFADVGPVGSADHGVIERCGGSGGGVLGSIVDVTDSTVSGNIANAHGGGVAAAGDVTITRSGVNENEATFGNGGGVAIAFVRVLVGQRALSGVVTTPMPTVTVNTSTLSSNFAGGDGGGISAVARLPFIGPQFNEAIDVPVDPISVVLEFATVAGNEALGEEPFDVVPTAIETPAQNILAEQLTAAASIIAYGVNPDGANCTIVFDPGVTSLGYNWDDDGTCGLDDATDTSGADPMLGPLAAGAHTPLDGSPVIDAVPTDFTTAEVSAAAAQCAGTDQLGTPRPSGVSCDIGAVEVAQAPPVAVDDAVSTGFGQAITVVVLDNDEDPSGIL